MNVKLGKQKALLESKIKHKPELLKMLNESYESISFWDKIDSKYDVNDFLKPSITYIYNAYKASLNDQWEVIAKDGREDTSILYFQHFEHMNFLSAENLQYELQDADVSTPLVNRYVWKWDCSDMALFRYTYMSLQWVPCKMFVIPGQSDKLIWHRWFWMKLEDLRKTSFYKLHLNDRGEMLNEYQAKKALPCTMQYHGETYVFFDEAFEFTSKISDYENFLKERGYDRDDLEILSNASLLEWLQQEHMTTYFDKEYYNENSYSEVSAEDR